VEIVPESRRPTGLCSFDVDPGGHANGGLSARARPPGTGPLITGFNGGDLVTLDGSRSSGAGETLTYAWTQLTGTPVVLSAPDAAITTFTAANVTETLTFQLTVTDPLGLTDSCVTAIAISCVPVSITQQPADQTVCSGDAATFTVAAESISDVTYQWQQRAAGGAAWTDLTDGGAISGAGTPTLALASTGAASAGDYRCVVTSTCGAVISDAATLTLQPATAIVTQPADQAVAIIEVAPPVSFSVTATGSGLRYQWQFNGVNLVNGGVVSGANSRVLTISQVSPNHAGSYRCVVTGDCGSATSRGALLTVTFNTGGITPDTGP
jgi:hypothetical protein